MIKIDSHIQHHVVPDWSSSPLNTAVYRRESLPGCATEPPRPARERAHIEQKISHPCAVVVYYHQASRRLKTEIFVQMDGVNSGGQKPVSPESIAPPPSERDKTGFGQEPGRKTVHPYFEVVQDES
jgi:hypothetical protein